MQLLERLTDNLRAVSGVNVPILTQLFLCTRVLISRISAEALASLWFIVIPELVSDKFKIESTRFFFFFMLFLDERVSGVC